jgi:hypothetical protein
MISKEAMHFINHCYKNGLPVGCRPIFKMEYQFGQDKVKFSEGILEEIIQSKLVKVSNQTDRQVDIHGIGGR